MTVTIRDIAKKAGVSPSTVSRVINGKSVISNETRNKIFAVMEELDFHPNSLARNLANGSSRALALVINAEDKKSFSNQYFTHSVFGIEQIAQTNGYNLIITHNQSKGMTPIEQLIYEKKADGIILPPSLITISLLKKLLNQKFPFVVLGEPPFMRNEVNWVDINNAQGSESAVNHLLEKGYRSIVFVGENQQQIFTKNRIAGFRDALGKQGIEPRQDFIIESDGTQEAAYRIAVSFLQKTSPPDAFLCSDNTIAFGILKAVKSLERAIPQEIGIVTFDNYPLAQYTEPSLTSIDVDTYLLGEHAAFVLLKTIENETNIQHILVGTKLFQRESTDRNL